MSGEDIVVISIWMWNGYAYMVEWWIYTSAFSSAERPPVTRKFEEETTKKQDNVTHVVEVQFCQSIISLIKSLHRSKAVRLRRDSMSSWKRWQFFWNNFCCSFRWRRCMEEMGRWRWRRRKRRRCTVLSTADQRRGENCWKVTHARRALYLLLKTDKSEHNWTRCFNSSQRRQWRWM